MGGVGTMTRASEIPIAHTPAGGWHGEMPPPVLAGCDEPLAMGAPVIRGLWEVVKVEVGGQVVEDHPVLGQRQRVEQCGDRLVVTASGIVHDMRCDGTEEHGVHDVAQIDYATPIDVVASYENGVHVLRPKGMPLTVTRRLDGDVLVWDYGGIFIARLERVDDTPLGRPVQSAPVRSRQYLHVVTGRIFEVEAAPVVVDCVHLLVPGVSPIRETALADASEDGVELLLGDQEGVVMTLWSSTVVVVETDAVGRLDAHEGPEALRRIEAEDLGQKCGRRLFVSNRDDGVVELNGHERSLQVEPNSIIGLAPASGSA